MHFKACLMALVIHVVHANHVLFLLDSPYSLYP